MFDWLKTTKSKKESISKDLNNLSENSINNMFSEENLKKRENSEKLFSKDESVRKKVKEDFVKDLRDKLNEDNQRYIKKDELNSYCNEEIEQKTKELEARWEKEEEKKRKEEREAELKSLRSTISR